MPTVNEIKRSYGAQQAQILTETFDLGVKARQIDVSIPASTRDRLSPRDFDRVRAAEAAVGAEAERDRLKGRYEDLDLELRAAIQIRVEEVEREFSPENADFRDFAAAATATPEALIAAMDMALDAGNEDAALVAFAAGRQRDLEDVVAHAITVREDWSDLYAELAEAAGEPELDPGDRFEMWAQKAPGEQTILGGPPSDRNITGMMR